MNPTAGENYEWIDCSESEQALRKFLNAPVGAHVVQIEEWKKARD